MVVKAGLASALIVKVLVEYLARFLPCDACCSFRAGSFKVKKLNVEFRLMMQASRSTPLRYMRRTKLHPFILKYGCQLCAN